MSNTITRISREMMHISDNVFYISFSVLVLLICLIVVYWFYTRKRMQELQHQIPADVLKSYLDSVIQNSNALKSSLFRGGGLEGGEGIPSVVPGGSLPSGNVDSAELATKNAEIAALNGQIANKASLISDLEAQLAAVEQTSGNSDSTQIITNLNSEIAQLKAALEDAKNSAGDAVGSNEINEKLQEDYDLLKLRLQEYEMIEGDLADLRKYKQENEELKAKLAGQGDVAESATEEVAPEPIVEEIAPDPIAEEVAPEPIAEEEPAAEEVAPEPVAEEAPAPVEEPAQAPEPVADSAPEPIEEATAASAETPAEEAKDNSEGEQKTAEELLSEFEKMLG